MKDRRFKIGDVVPLPHGAPGPPWILARIKGEVVDTASGYFGDWTIEVYGLTNYFRDWKLSEYMDEFILWMEIQYRATVLNK